MKKIRIKRTNISSYFSANFAEQERKSLATYADFSDEEGCGPEVLITNTETDIESLWKKGEMEGVKLIIHPNSGYDNYSIEFIKSSNIPVILGNPIRQEAVVSYCLSCIFERSTAIPWRTSWEEGRSWSRPLLHKQTALIIGNGHVGSSLNQKITSLFKEVLIHDPFKKLDCLSEVARADYVFICAGLNSTSENLINKSLLQKLKPTVNIINPARGKIVNLQDLKDFLLSHPKSQAYIDVFPKEPYPIEELKDVKNLKLSCHVAGVYLGIEEEIISFEKNVLHDYINLSFDKFLDKYRDENLQNKIFKDNLI